MSEFLGKICRFEYGKSLPDKDRVPGAVLVYGSNGIIGTHSESYTFGETIVIGRKGSIGEINLVSDSCWPIDTTYYIDRTCTDCDLLWLSFVLRSLKLEVLNKGTGVPGLNREDAYKQRIQIPFSIEEQRQIAEKLKAQFAEVETARKALELQQQEIVNLANTIIRESIEQSVGAGHARDLSHGGDPSRARPAPTEWQQQEIVNLANTLIRASLEQFVGAGHARDLSHGDDPSRARPAPTEWQQQEIVNLANTLIRESIEQSVGAGHARDLSHGDDPSRARPAPTELQQQEIVKLANTIIRASIEQSVGAGHARDLSHGDDPSRARPAPTELQQQEIVNLANTLIRASIEQSVGAGHARDLNHGDDPSRARPAPTDKPISVTETRLGEVLEEIKKGIGETWADYPVLGATRGGLAPAKEQPGKYPQRYKPVSCGTVFYNPMRIMIGSIAFVDDDDEPGITSPDYVALRGKPGLVDSRWFYYWLRSPYGEHCINSLARGAVRERMLFNRLAEGSILLPSYPEQLRASKALATLKSMKSAIQKQLNDLDKIPERLLAQAFEKI